MKQELFYRDGSLRVVIVQSSGQTEIYSAQCQLLGVYNPTSDITTDAFGQLVGRGDLLTTLC
jgi:hypothetical protein